MAHAREFGAACKRIADMRVLHSVRTGGPALGIENCKHIRQRRTKPAGQRVDVLPRRTMFLEPLLPLLSLQRERESVRAGTGALQARLTRSSVCNISSLGDQGLAESLGRTYGRAPSDDNSLQFVFDKAFNEGLVQIDQRVVPDLRRSCQRVVQRSISDGCLSSTHGTFARTSSLRMLFRASRLPDSAARVVPAASNSAFRIPHPRAHGHLCP